MIDEAVQASAIESLAALGWHSGNNLEHSVTQLVRYIERDVTARIRAWQRDADMEYVFPHLNTPVGSPLINWMAYVHDFKRGDRNVSKLLHLMKGYTALAAWTATPLDWTGSVSPDCIAKQFMFADAADLRKQAEEHVNTYRAQATPSATAEATSALQAVLDFHTLPRWDATVLTS